MAVPDFQTIMRPLLDALAGGDDKSVQAIRGELAQHFALSQNDLAEMIPSGRAKTFSNRVGWATTYLYRSGLIDRPKRSTYRLTPRGEQVLRENPKRVDMKVLAQFDEFNEFKSKNEQAPAAHVGTLQPPTPSTNEQTPEEQMASANVDLQAALTADVLDRVREQTPEFFEQLVLDVLYAIGYGGHRDGATSRLGRSGDEGVDGVIREDELGLDLIYVQAKRWANPVGRPEIQKFFGALHGQRATKGVFITTSTFTAEAAAYADGVTPRVILVDGKELARLMVAHGVGVSVARTFEVKRLDIDYFAGDDDNDAIATST